MTPAARLRKAADLIETQGWFQGNFYDLTAPVRKEGAVDLWDCHCPVTGIGTTVLTVHDTTGHTTTLRLLADAIDPEGKGGFSVDRIARWNDDPRRTRAEVVAKLREVADSLETPQEVTV